MDTEAAARAVPVTGRPLTRSRHHLTFAVLAVGVFSYSFQQSSTVPTLPLIADHLDTDIKTATWLMTAFLLSSSVATPIVGRLGDAYGKRRMLVMSLAGLAIGSVAAAFAPTIELMIAARVFQGIAGGAIPLTFAIIRDEMPGKQVPRALAVTSSLLAAGFAAGTVCSGPIAESLGVAGLFLAPAAVAGLAALAIQSLIPESPIRSRERVPLIPAILLAGWLTSLLLGISKGPEWGWSDARTFGLLGAAVLLLLAWAFAEQRIETPLIDLQLMRRRGVWTTNLVGMTAGMVTFGALTFMPQFNQTPSENGYGFGVSTTVAGHMMLPSLVATFVCGFVAAPLVHRLGNRLTMLTASLFAVAGTLLAAFAHDHPWQLYLANGVTGLGTGLVFACLAGAIISAVPAEQTGVATAMNTNIRTIGGSIGLAIMTTLVTASPLASGYPREHGYVVGFLFLTAAATVAAIVSLAVPAGRRAAAVMTVPAETA